MKWKYPSGKRGWIIPLALVLFVGLTLTSGCVRWRTMHIGLSEGHIKNTDVLEEATANFLCAWPYYDGIIRGSLRDRMKEIPGKVEDALDELTTLAEMCKDLDPGGEWEYYCNCNFTDWNPEFDIVYTEQNRTDFGLGYSVGCEIKICTDIVKDALENLAPDLLKAIPWPAL